MAGGGLSNMMGSVANAAQGAIGSAQPQGLTPSQSPIAPSTAPPASQSAAAAATDAFKQSPAYQDFVSTQVLPQEQQSQGTTPAYIGIGDFEAKQQFQPQYQQPQYQQPQFQQPQYNPGYGYTGGYPGMGGMGGMGGYGRQQPMGFGGGYGRQQPMGFGGGYGRGMGFGGGMGGYGGGYGRQQQMMRQQPMGYGGGFGGMGGYGRGNPQQQQQMMQQQQRMMQQQQQMAQQQRMMQQQQQMAQQQLVQRMMQQQQPQYGYAGMDLPQPYQTQDQGLASLMGGMSKQQRAEQETTYDYMKYSPYSAAAVMPEQPIPFMPGGIDQLVHMFKKGGKV